MKRRRFVVGIAVLSLVGNANAQPRMRRVALVTIADVTREPLASFARGLRELGYEEDRNLELLPPTAAGYGQLGSAAKAAVERKPEVIVTDGSTATRAAKAATWTIPIVMVVGVDPIEHGFVRELARPEGNITGIAHSGQLLSAKRLELLKEVLPGARRVGVLWSGGESASQAASLKITESAAARLGLSIFPAEVSQPSALKAAFEALSKARIDALIQVPSSMLDREMREILRLAAAHKMPVVYAGARGARSGALLSYGSDRPADFRRAAVFVDKILKGAKPAELPVEQPTKFELVVNLKTAKALGIEISKSVLFRADEVIE